MACGAALSRRRGVLVVRERFFRLNAFALDMLGLAIGVLVGVAAICFIVAAAAFAAAKEF
jgi:hypothetical protein